MEEPILVGEKNVEILLATRLAWKQGDWTEFKS